MTRTKIKNLIEKSIKELYKIEVEVKVERPENKEFGDYSTNIAMMLGENPQKIVESINWKLEIGNWKFLDKVEVNNGFINFFLSEEYLQRQVRAILKQGEKFGQLNTGKKIKAQVEFISANPTGQLHVGNGRGAFFGDILANVLEKAGYKVEREYYINDAKVNTQIKLLGQTAVGEGVTYLNDYLRLKIKNQEPKIKNIIRKCENKEKLYGEAGYLLAQEVQKDIKKFIEKRLKIKFNNWVLEEELYKRTKIKKIYQWLKNKKLIYKKEGAGWLKISEFGAPKDEVIVRKDGNPTYFLSDIAYHKDKFARNFKKIINIWGADHQGHVPKIKAAAKILGYKGDLDILICQMVRLKRGKISKRKGEIITLESLINEVGLDTARFFYLTKSLNTQMEFDLALAKEQSEKNPVYYIQYAHARICSILRQKELSSLRSLAPYRESENLNLLNHPSELALIKQFIRLPEIIEDTAKDYQVQRIPQYATDLATAFHQFYRDCKVLTETRSLREARLALILATRTVLKNTLDVIGVSAPERM